MFDSHLPEKDLDVLKSNKPSPQLKWSKRFPMLTIVNIHSCILYIYKAVFADSNLHGMPVTQPITQ